MSVKIVIDSACDISAAEAEKLGVELMPIEVRFGDEQYLDGVNLLPADFYQKLASSEEFPKTSMINEYAFDKKFSQLTGLGHEVVAITLSSKLSGTYQSAVNAAGKYKGKVFVVDSLNASIGERLLCEYALKLAADGLDAAQIAAKAEENKKNIRFYALLDTLEYLKKGGRVSALTAFAGQLLYIKPLICVSGGEIKSVGKAIGFKKGSAQLASEISKLSIDWNMPYGVIYSGSDDSRIKKFIIDSGLFKDSPPIYLLGCTVGAHIGPGGIGVAFFSPAKRI